MTLSFAPDAIEMKPLAQARTFAAMHAPTGWPDPMKSLVFQLCGRCLIVMSLRLSGRRLMCISAGGLATVQA
ncbi:hypothetical protein JI664_04940 [Rhodobacter sp. NTK016B]|uniref:hypothetical protein n=1 Tax=Rhodobacter sp. NTK016B TaxID=2759676 RepID=UPI001A904EFF|nr:hypothetical protein [Rhodobacter sp. NTK016B]MBN8291301.1 hypothetical protein [Rhodobacter sp. NTK016B]